MDGVKDLGSGHRSPQPASHTKEREQGMSAVSALETLQLQLLERWSSLLLRTFASMMAEHATTEPLRSEFIAFYVALAKLHGHVKDLVAASDQRRTTFTPNQEGYNGETSEGLVPAR